MTSAARAEALIFALMPIAWSESNKLDSKRHFVVRCEVVPGVLMLWRPRSRRK
jgi:hypothetical protein